MPRNNWRRLAVVLLLAAPAVGGCGKRGGTTVSGKVYYEGKPLTSGSVIFIDARGNTLPTVIRPDGSYQVVGVARGEAKIAVVSHARSPAGLRLGGRGTSPAAARLPATAPPGHESKAPQSRPPAIPARYRDPDQSQLTCEVTGRDQSHDIELRP